MLRLYIRFYFALVASLALFLVATAVLWRLMGGPMVMPAGHMLGHPSHAWAVHFHLLLTVLALSIGVAAYPLVRQISRRLERLQRGVESLGAGNLSARVPVEGKDEVARLAGSFNRAAAQIEQLVNANKTLLANTSHELRTPLARIRLAVELLQDSADAKRRAGLEQDIAELDWLVDEILLASRLDTVTQAIETQEVDLLALAAEECSRYDAAQLEGEPGVIRADPRLLRRLLRNLLENAARHGAPPTQVRIARDSTAAIITVWDGGQGVPPAEFENVFRPFYRPSSGAQPGGTGLGLSLVRQIARRHGGDARCATMPRRSQLLPRHPSLCRCLTRRRPKAAFKNNERQLQGDLSELPHTLVSVFRSSFPIFWITGRHLPALGCAYTKTGEETMATLARKTLLGLGIALGLSVATAMANEVDGVTRDEDGNAAASCIGLPTYHQLQTALDNARAQANGGFNLDMWGTVVNRDGLVCAVAFTGSNRGAQWPGSRIISAQKANTANAFSLPKLALSTADLYAAVQPGGTLYGLQHSNPVDTKVAYRGPAANFGQDDDPMIGHRIGGVNVFGGGLALYNSKGVLIGGIGVSGDTSCADHNIAWRTRHNLNLDFVPAGVSNKNDDNINYQGLVPVPSVPNDFSHPICKIGGVDSVSAISLTLLPPVQKVQ